ncbi:WD40/YVTN/BNR-like repeat-containing protein [Nonlabens ponticola]|uniref:Glycosyl hydrolase n=1 Tax=Nonlabens ponticola TaxID=2496866 RepID=A0A3S9N0K4_9FLAO|nr:sialidase family protein [Nonlabens ponticola]AZQ45065.1 glycosyl hydrolase [Nonlabens ponticola]
MKISSIVTYVFLVFAFAKANSQQLPEPPEAQKFYESQKFRQLGPFRGGRSAAVTGVPGQPNLFYFGSTGGGVWKTLDGGRTWMNISDGYFGGSIGAVSVAPSDHNVIYVGGGEKTVRGNVSSGYGIWKTVDAGKTWEFSGLPESRHVPRIAIDPNDHNIVYAGVLGNIYKESTDRGVYKSIDGGKNWKKVLYVNDMAGAVDLIIDPSNPRNLYATTWRLQRTPYSLSSGGDGSAMWKSTDYGETWKEISTNDGFAQGTLGIMGVTVSPVNSDRVYAIVENKDEGGVYRSNDGGLTWTKTNDDRSLRQRAWYYTRIYADTQDEDKVYVVNVSYHKSTDGGRNFISARAPHGDHHDLWIAPEDPDRMIMGDDGGAQITYDGGETWSTYHNQPTAQYYRVTTDDSFPYRIYVAQQDNGTIRIPHRTTGGSITDADWEGTAGGESAHIAVDPKNNDIVYGGSYGGFLTRYNHATKSTRAVNVWPDNPMGHGAEDMKYRFQWNFPILFSKHEPNKLYAFSNHVHVTTNEGESWQTLSDDLTRNDPTKLVSSGGPITQDNTSVEYYGTIFAAAESPVKQGELWVGSDDGLVHLSKDGGQSWNNITPKKLPEWAQINSIEPSRYDAATCYLAATRYKLGDFKPYLFRTTDYGKSWQQINDGIPSEHFTRVVREDDRQKGFLYAGTETGLYISDDNGDNWSSFQMNLPIVPITDLAVKQNNLVVATQGRSLWIHDDLELVRQGLKMIPLSRKRNKQTTAESLQLFAPKTAYRMAGRGGRSSLTSGTNHPAGVQVHYYIPEAMATDSVALKFYDSNDKLIKEYSTYDKKNKLKVDAGSNMFNWDTEYDGAKELPGMILWWADLTGPRATPGTYKVVLETPQESLERNIEIVAAPNSEATAADMQSQFDFVDSVNETVDEAHKSIEKIRDFNKKLKAFKTAYGDREEDGVKEMVELADTMLTKFDEVEKALYQTQNRSGQDPLNFPIRLTNKLAHLNALASVGDFAPTQQMIAVRDELSAEIETELAKFNKVLSDDIKQFNQKFNALNLDYLVVEESDED